MFKLKGLQQLLLEKEYIKVFEEIYGNDDELINSQIQRYSRIINLFATYFEDEMVGLFSAPGRTEIGGNHTDHNHGKVLAASINLDTVAVAAKCEESIITVYSEGYPEPFVIHLNDIGKSIGEQGTTPLLKGIVKGFEKFDFNVGGFHAYISSDVVNASGLSSSASIEMLFCSILDTFYNDSKLNKVTYAKIGQYAENHYWDKPSGLLDQMACAIGGMVSIDFSNSVNPLVKTINSSGIIKNYDLVIVHTGGNHADLTNEYASITTEMQSVANALGKKYCNEISLDRLLSEMNRIRSSTVGDRALLRVIHFLEENDRVDRQVQAILSEDYKLFLRLIKQSGNSSWKYLQNCYTADSPKDQPIPYALALTEIYLKALGDGACRVHGGGFAGVIQVFIPKKNSKEYISFIEGQLGNHTTYHINIRKYGVINFEALL